MPPAWRVCPATPDDYDACARLFAALEVPDSVWSAARFAESVAPDTLVLREDDGAVAAYAWGRPRGDVFHVVHVAVDPARRRAGAGDLLMQALATRARTLGLARWMLNVKPENIAARRLYEKHGMEVAFASASVRFPWPCVTRLPHDPGLRARALGADDDAAFEVACALAPGEIASLRSQGRVPLGVRARGGAPLAFGALDEHRPGVAPVRASSGQLLRALLDAARALAPEGATAIRVFAEGAPALEQALTQAGGEVVLRALRMHGDLG